MPAHEPYDPAEDRERVRGWMTLALVLLFLVLIIALLLAGLLGHLAPDQLDKLVALLVSPVSGLLGAVVGFYYGEKARA